MSGVGYPRFSCTTHLAVPLNDDVSPPRLEPSALLSHGSSPGAIVSAVFFAQDGSLE